MSDLNVTDVTNHDMLDKKIMAIMDYFRLKWCEGENGRLAVREMGPGE